MNKAICAICADRYQATQKNSRMKSLFVLFVHTMCAKCYGLLS